MTPADLRLVASLLRSAIKEGTALPELAPRMADQLISAAPGSWAQKAAWRREFLATTVPPKAGVNGNGQPKIDPGREAPPPRTSVPSQLVEGDAALFQAILATDFPQLAGVVGCKFVANLPSRFSVGRVGPSVWIRFGKQACEDPIGAVHGAAREAEEMVSGRTQATRIVGR